MLGEIPTQVYHPSSDPADYGYASGEWFDNNRQSATMNLTIEPMSRGNYLRTVGDEGSWTGGAILIFDETDGLVCPSDLDAAPKPGSWVVFDGAVYQVDSRSRWTDDELGHAEFTAFLMRPQPTLP